MNGIRLNEAFGDTVNWDLIPSVAIERADMWSSNPVFGLNALGGAVNIQMKNGFIWQGFEAQAQGGSNARMNGSVQYGAQKDNYAVYLAAEGLRDQGWRYQSPSELRRIYGDFGWRADGAEIHLITTAARNHFGVVGPTPVDLLARDWKSIYTWPQTTLNQMGLAASTAPAVMTLADPEQRLRPQVQAGVDGNGAEPSGSGNPPTLCSTRLPDDDGSCARSTEGRLQKPGPGSRSPVRRPGNHVISRLRHRRSHQH